MLTEFDNLSDAQKLCDDIHEYLKENCEGYSASKWFEPVKQDKVDIWIVPLPVEYQQQDNPIAEKISLSKAVAQVEKLPDNFYAIADFPVLDFPTEEV
jgi:hypothetical protein